MNEESYDDFHQYHIFINHFHKHYSTIETLVKIFNQNDVMKLKNDTSNILIDIPISNDINFQGDHKFKVIINIKLSSTAKN